MIPFRDSTVQSVFCAYPAPVRDPLLALRALIFETAEETEGCGQILECLKWGQPAYLTEKPKSGTTIRIDAAKDIPNEYAIFFHCQTRMIATLRDLYEDELVFDGNRAIRMTVDNPPPNEIIRHCLAMALTYHLKPRHRKPMPLSPF